VICRCQGAFTNLASSQGLQAMALWPLVGAAAAATSPVARARASSTLVTSLLRARAAAPASTAARGASTAAGAAAAAWLDLPGGAGRVAVSTATLAAGADEAPAAATEVHAGESGWAAEGQEGFSTGSPCPASWWPQLPAVARSCQPGPGKRRPQRARRPLPAAPVAGRVGGPGARARRPAAHLPAAEHDVCR
jgi:hypothetical protein